MEMEVDIDDLKRQEKEDKERRKLLDIFPEELWEKIFETCGGDEDTLIACSNASCFWRELLEQKRTAYLFPKVLKILTEQNYLTKDHSADLLQFRKVCKTWRVGVNALLETPAHQKSLRFEDYRHSLAQDVAYSTYFRLYLSDSEEVWNKLESELLPQLDSSFYKDGSSPFPSRTLEIFGERPNDDIWYNNLRLDYRTIRLRWERGLSLVEHLLEKGGHHFWSATLSFDSQISVQQWHPFVHKFAHQMPNLKSLYIINGPYFGGSDAERLQERPPFPTLSNLELVSMEKVPEWAMKSICSANPHVKICIIPSFIESVGVFRTPAWNLETRAINRQELIGSFDFGCISHPQAICASFHKPGYFQKLPEHWNLKVLCVNLTKCSTLKLPAIFKKLECYKKSLTELQLSVPSAVSEDEKLILWESSRTPLHLPKLTRLEIEMRNICSLDFLLGLMSLEHLIFDANHIENSPPSRGTRVQLIDFLKWGETKHEASEFRKCNIWNYIPSLKKVTIKYRVPNSLHSDRFMRHLESSMTCYRSRVNY